MVCDNCQKKLGKVVTQDVWKAGARNTTESGGRKIDENKLLTGRANNRFNPYTTSFKKCRVCKSNIHQAHAHFCTGCAYKKGICAMCGVRLIDVKNYKQSST